MDVFLLIILQVIFPVFALIAVGVLLQMKLAVAESTAVFVCLP